LVTRKPSTIVEVPHLLGELIGCLLSDRKREIAEHAPRH
jgi:hypothetical protein